MKIVDITEEREAPLLGLYPALTFTPLPVESHFQRLVRQRATYSHEVTHLRKTVHELATPFIPRVFDARSSRIASHMGLRELTLHSTWIRAALPKSLTKLSLHYCSVDPSLEWDLPNLRSLHLTHVVGVCGFKLGRAVKQLEEIYLSYYMFADDFLCVTDLSRLRTLEVGDYLFWANAHIANALCGFRLQKLRMLSHECVLRLLEPELKRSSCTLTKLQLGHREPALAVWYRHVVAVRTLLQLRKRRCPLRRLPVEMMRLVGGMLI